MKHFQLFRYYFYASDIQTLFDFYKLFLDLTTSCQLLLSCSKPCLFTIILHWCWYCCMWKELRWTGLMHMHVLKFLWRKIQTKWNWYDKPNKSRMKNQSNFGFHTEIIQSCCCDLTSFFLSCQNSEIIHAKVAFVIKAKTQFFYLNRFFKVS